MRLLRRFRDWISKARTWWYAREAFTARHVADEPDRLDRGVAYLVGDPTLWMVVLSCPCGCDQPIHLNLMRSTRPRWELTQHADGTISVIPSVWRTSGCRSHFWLNHGRVAWSSRRRGDGRG
jgi:hypothetical protein